MFTKFVNLNLLFLIVISLGCTDAEISNDKLSFNDIADILFDAKSSRLTNQGSFVGVSGLMTLYFSGNEESGELKISFQAFYEPALCPYLQDCRCYGTLYATYNQSESTSTGSETNLPYDPSAPLIEEPLELSTNVLDLSFSLTIDKERTKLSERCPGQINRSIKVYVYQDKSLTLFDLGHEYQLKPRLL